MMKHLAVETKMLCRKMIVLMTKFGKVFQTQDMKMRGPFTFSLGMHETRLLLLFCLVGRGI